MNSEKKHSVIEGDEYGVDSRYLSKKERESEATALMEARLLKMKNLTDDQITRAKLVQLNFQMKEYLEQNSSDDKHPFSSFLQSYVDAIYSSRAKFAQDITITPILLSQIINNHRKPKDEFILKLMIHSEKVYKGICDFKKELWLQVYYHEKLCNTISNQSTWLPKLEKEITLSESVG